MNYNNAVFETSFGKPSQIFKSDLPEIVFSGRSNVGKSSLINKLLNRKSLARVSSKPGKTGTINFYKIDNKIRLADLPGYGYAKVSASEKLRWSSLVEGYFQLNRNITLVIQIVDIRHMPTKDDMSMLAYLGEQGLNTVVVLTKSDKLSRNQKEEQVNNIKNAIDLPDSKFVIFSSQTGEGVEELKLKIEQGYIEN